MARARFLITVRELARCYQAFEAFSAAHVRSLGLTSSQFDVVATLGNTHGMTFKELGERTLITKGTLTGVVDRMAQKGWVRRMACPSDGRSVIVQLTAAGEALFERIFPAHLAHLERAFDALSAAELDSCDAALRRLRAAFERADGESIAREARTA